MRFVESRVPYRILGNPPQRIGDMVRIEYGRHRIFNPAQIRSAMLLADDDGRTWLVMVAE